MYKSKSFKGFSRSHLKPKYSLNSRLETIVQSFRLIPNNKLKKLYLVVFSTFINSFLSLVSIAFLVPIIYVALNPKDFYNKYNDYLPLFLNETKHEALIIFLCLIFIFLACIKFLYSLFHTYINNDFSTKLQIELACDILSKINKMPYLWTVKKNQLYFRDIALNRTSDWGRGTINVTMNLLGDLFFLIMAFIGVLYTNFLFAIYISTFITISGFFIWKFVQPKLLKLSAERIKFARLGDIAAIDISTAGREIRFLGRQNALLDDFKSNHINYGFVEVTGKIYKAIPKEALEFIATIVLASLIIIGMTDYIKIDSFKDTLLLIVILALRILPLISKILNTLVQLETQRPNISELTSFLNELKDNYSEDKSINKNIFKNWSNIKFKKVKFLFEEKRGVKDISLNISRGENICIVGDTGAGKTTFVDLLSGLLLTQNGQIFIDDQSLTKYNNDTWRKNLIYVPQNPIMIDDTIENNILWGQNKGSIKKLNMNEVLDKVCLNHFVNDLKNGLNTIIGDNGKLISGGQKQRIALARALWSQPSLIILDEATNALDPITEKQIINNFKSDSNKRISYIFISHRLSIAKEVDKVMFFKQGQLFKVGTHKSLYKAFKEYRSLYDASK
jgi:ABC-type bacteriocin/lantibiotic exporter with double-glycine peptidase domain